jgi:hypothetical protein
LPAVHSAVHSPGRIITVIVLSAID